MRRTMTADQDCWTEFSNGEAPGLLANISCIFPNTGNRSMAKEVNLSAWRTAEDAENWQANSAGYAKVVADRKNGTLGTFGSATTDLRHVGGVIRYQDRCSRCARVVESTTVGDAPPGRCIFCNA